MRTAIRALSALLLVANLAPRPAGAAVNVVTSTEDLAALVLEVHAQRAAPELRAVELGDGVVRFAP